MAKVSDATIRSAMEENVGWCTHCEEFTRGETEPDAEGYDCPVCKNNTVSGAELSLIQGDVEIADERTTDGLGND